MFLKYFFILIKEFGQNFKKEMTGLFLMSTVGGFLELLGIAMIFPVILVLSSNEEGSGKFVADFISNLFPSISYDKIGILLSLLMIGVFIFKNVFMLSTVKLQNDFAKKWADYVNNIVLEKLLYAPFFDSAKIPSGDKFTLIFSSVRDISLDFVLRCVIMLANAIVAFCIIILLFYKFTIPAFLSTVFILVYAYFENSFFRKKAKELGITEVKYINQLSESADFIINSEKEIKCSNKETYFKDYIMDNTRKVSGIYSKSISYGTYPLYITEIGVILAFLIMVMSVALCGNITKTEIISSLAVIALMVLRLVPQLNKVLMSMYAINKTKQKVFWFLEKYEQISKFPVEEYKNAEKMPYENLISLKDVSFEYETKRGIKNITLSIKKGEFIGVIGKSGAGKTTLIDIISGLNLPQSGEIYIDNNLIDKNNIMQWRKNISLLPQEPAFLSGTILENIAFGEIEPDIKRAKEALAFSGLDFDINSNINLSVGQKRRVALARAYYKQSTVLILDEATSALDIESENIVVENLLKFKGEKTIIAIAHRLSTLKMCDRIIYLYDGKIKDTGSLYELREKYTEIEDMIKISSFDSNVVEL